jgi:hypothetical protein
MPASNYLVGTAPDQVPSNADLGEMAFQSKDAVEFTGGKGGLSHLDITAISAQLNVSATDVFVYDTSKDSDGGAWRNRCQHTSWFNEELNTATRGERREFPAVAVIVATTTNITIYDGDSPNLPMWMVFVGGSAGLASTLMLQNGNYFSVAAMNGVLVTGVHTNSDNWGSPIINFISEKVVRMDPNTTEGGAWLGGGIAERNLQKGYASYAASGAGYLIVDSRITDVAITLLPNAPIDAATGLPNPTIAVATSNGISIINHHNIVYNLTPESEVSYNGIRNFFSVSFTRSGILLSDRQTGYGFSNAIYLPLYNYNVSLSDTYSKLLGSFSLEWSADIRDNRNGPGSVVGYWAGQANTGRHIKFTCTTKDSIVLGTTNELVLADQTDCSMVANIKSRYNTGWMPAGAKGAWLSDTTQETLLKKELIVNGDFGSGTTGWTASSGGSLSVSGGVLRITNGGSNGRAVGNAFQTTAGKQYRVKVTAINRSSSNASYRLEVRGPELAWNWTSATTQEVFFTAVEATTYIELYALGGAGEWVEFDNASVTEGDADRSIVANPLELFGTIIKTPVSAGADLVAYSGFSPSNYLAQPYNSALDFGTGDFSFICWFNFQNAGGGTQFITRGSLSSGLAIWSAADLQYVAVFIGGQQSVTGNGVYQNNVWSQLVVQRVNGTVGMYINGRSVHQSFNPANASGSTPATYSDATGNGSPRFALMRLSSTTLSEVQIAKMYNDEKHLFQDNAKATLYGTSDSVTALAYDEDTQLLHVGTSSGRSVFDGLRRVDNTTTAVSATISAANGLVVEN